ncbi:fibrous sheath CABYR-binding protein [Mus pahari]|uniref:fibrous sheath CABYR-binding protein n=1 Tax=Mus pahari TaxID=10093 RepID=UPI000A3058CF|nr:fibrous sheath CABYR-binding protein [Mus pahari]
MEESEEPEQPISLERQEYRRRRRPSQPMVDKSQQTDITEKRKAMASVQPPAPKATHSIGNIPGSKDNYSGKEYESLRLSSQLQKTWMKRKHVQDMIDKSLQTDPIVEEKVKVIFIDKSHELEENIADVGEIAPELPQSTPEVEIPTSRPTSHLIDRSQQTSCTGDWSLIYICPKEKVDKEQQTYFSELEITIRSMPGSSRTKSKEETIPIVQEGPLVEINGSLEIEVLSTEKLPDVMLSFTEGEISGELQALSDGEATVKGELFLTEESPIQAPSPTEETSAAETATTAKDVADIQAPPADKLSSVEAPADISPPLVQEALSDKPSDQQYPQGTEVAPSELPVEDLVPLSEEVLEKVQALTTDSMLEDSGRAESTTAEETSGKVQHPLSEETSKEVPAEVHFPIAADFEEIAIVIDKKFATDEVFEEYKPPIMEEVSADKVTAEVQPPSAEDASEEVVPSKVLPPSTEQGTVEDLTAEVLSPPTEESPTEVPPQPTEEGPAEVPPAPAEEVPAEVPPPLTEEGPAEVPPPPAEEGPEEVLPPLAEEGPEEVLHPLAEEGSAEVPPPLNEEGPAEVPSLPSEEAPTKVPPSPAEKGSAEFSPPPTEEGPAEVPPPPAEESPTELPPSSAEEGPAEVPPPPTAEGPEEAPAEVLPPSTEEAPVEVLPPATDEASAGVQPPAAEEGPAEVPPPPAEEGPIESPTHDVPTEVQLPQATESPAQVLPLSGESTAEEVSAQVQPPSFENAPLESLPLEEIEEFQLDDSSFEVQPLPTEDIAVGVPAEFQTLPADENPAREDTVETQPSSFEGSPRAENPVEAPLPAAEADIGREASAVHPLSLSPTDEAPAEIQILQTDNIPTEVAPVENQPLPAEEVFPKVVPEEEATAAEVRPPLSEGAPAEEATVEAQLTSVEESPKKASVDVQPLPPETPVEESPVVEPPLKTDVDTMQEFHVERMPAEDPLPPSEQTPADQVLPKEHRLSQVADISEKELESTTLTGDKMSEGTDSVPEDVSGTKDDQISTFKIEGTIKIELKN